MTSEIDHSLVSNRLQENVYHFILVDSPEEENFALGVDANGHPLGEPIEDESGTTKLDPMAQVGM